MQQDDLPAFENSASPHRIFTLITRILEASCFTTMTTWIFLNLGGLRVSPQLAEAGGNDTSKLFNWHPLLISIAFPVMMSEAVLSYKSPLISLSERYQKKALHFGLQTAAAVLTVLAVLAAFQSHNLKLPQAIPNLYSTHSYLGMMVLVTFSLQYTIGVLAYLYPKWSLQHRKKMGPLHIFFGRSIFVLGMATMAVGIQEKTTFIQTMQKPGLSAAVMKLPAVLQLLLALTTMAVLYHHTSPTAHSATCDAEIVQVPYRHHTECEPLHTDAETHGDC